MKVDLVRFKAADDVELQGWLSIEDSDIATLHIHGRSGNGYENYFLDNLREMYSQNKISFFSIDTRGRGIVTDFRLKDGWKHAGSCFEIFDESTHDIQGAIDYLKTCGKKKFILQGHSLGCTKIIHYLLSQTPDDVISVVLLAPTDMVGWAESDSKHNEYLAKAKTLLSEGKKEELVGAECWIDKTAISAETYPTICGRDSSADIYKRNALGQIYLPMLIPYGDKDIGIVKIDGTIEKWLERVSPLKNENTKISIIKGAEHGFRNYEKELTNVVKMFLTESVKFSV